MAVFAKFTTTILWNSRQQRILSHQLLSFLSTSTIVNTNLTGCMKSKINQPYSEQKTGKTTTTPSQELQYFQFDVANDGTVGRVLKGLQEQNRAILAEAITLAESTNPRKRAQAQAVLKEILEKSQMSEHKWKSGTTLRIGLSGPPGAGKSTFIEVFGKYLTCKDHRVAVLAVDPSSSTSGGSLLGDKTRMLELSRDPKAYIRASPSAGTLGGVARCTNDAIVLCEAAGYDIVIVETIGVGQSEYAVADMVDLFLLLIPPAGGDEMQGIKKGITEVTDIVAVNKSDGDLVAAAKRIQAEYISALKFMRSKNSVWRPWVTRISSMTKEGIPELWDKVQEFRELVVKSGEYDRRRHSQHMIWMWNHIRDNALRLFKQNPKVKEKIPIYEDLVSRGVMTPGYAADALIREFVKATSENHSSSSDSEEEKNGLNTKQAQ